MVDDGGEPFRNIAIDFSEVLKRMKDTAGCVTVGPWFDKNPYNLFDGLISASCIRLSDYTGMVDLKELYGGEARLSESPSQDGTLSFHNCTFNINFKG